MPYADPIKHRAAALRSYHAKAQRFTRLGLTTRGRPRLRRAPGHGLSKNEVARRFRARMVAQGLTVHGKPRVRRKTYYAWQAFRASLGDCKAPELLFGLDRHAA